MQIMILGDAPHSARIESPKSAFADKVNGTSNILIVETLQKKLEINKTIVERYRVFHQNLPQGKTRFCSIMGSPDQSLTKIFCRLGRLLNLADFSLWSQVPTMTRKDFYTYF